MKKSPWTIVILVVVIAAAAANLIWHYTSQPKPGDAEATLMPIACANPSCGKAYQGMMGNQPGRCAFCKQPTAWRAMLCLNKKCNAIFPLVSTKKDGKVAYESKCPKCGGQSCTEEVPPERVPPPP